MLRAGRLAVVAVWIGLLLALARSHWPHGSPPLEAAPPAGAGATIAEDTWTGVYMRGEKIGYSHTRITPTEQGYRFDESSYLRLSVMDQVQTVRAQTEAKTDADFALRTFTVSLDSGLGVFKVRGAADDRELVMNVTVGDDTTEQRVPLDEPIFLPSSARARLRATTLEPGRTLTLRVFDPTTMEHRPLQMRVVGRESITLDGATVDAWHIRETFQGVESSVWLDDAGHTLREEGPMEMVVQREDATRAFAGGWGDDAFDLMGAVAVRVKKPIEDPRRLAHLDARLSGLGDISVPSGSRQRWADGVVRIEREPRTASGYTLPYTGEEWRGELSATPFLQVDHPRIRATAKQIVGSQTDPRLAANLLRSWVYDELEKRPVASIPNALQVLDTRAGDCNEHAVLFAALARAAGIPTRVVAGIVYADGVFLYHAWDEVWIGSWLTVDAAFDQMPADATHVKLIEGGPETHAELMAVIGRLSIEPLPPPSESASS